MPFGNLAQLPLDGAGTAEQATVHPIETVIGRPEHETTGDTDGNPHRAAIEFDRKSLRNHDDSTPGAQQSPDAVAQPRCSRLPDGLMRKRSLEGDAQFV